MEGNGRAEPVFSLSLSPLSHASLPLPNPLALRHGQRKHQAALGVGDQAQGRLSRLGEGTLRQPREERSLVLLHFAPVRRRRELAGELEERLVLSLSR